MKIIIKFSSEITIKSRSVRIFFIKILVKNIKIILYKHNKSVLIKRYWDYLEVKYINDNYLPISKILINIPGIHHFLLVQDSVINSLEDIYHQIMLTDCCHRLLNKTFCVRVKRCGNHTVTSQDIECYIGNKLCCKINNVSVNLNKPDETIFLEIKNNLLFIIIKRYSGLGGLPIGTQQEFLSLISGGFDSSVSSYMLIRRGCKVHYCFFNLVGDTTHVIEIYRIIYYLWNRFSYSHNVKVITVDFSGVVQEICNRIKSNYTGIILKRMMIRAASYIASCRNIKALATGEALGQVSSQTLNNLILINNLVPSNSIILRPLIVYDKELIIELSRKIGTEKFSKNIPEFCGFISKKSSIKISKKQIELEEGYFDMTILNKAISNFDIIDVYNIPYFIMNQHVCKIITTNKLCSQDVVLDIRTEVEQKNNPINISIHIKVQKIPFYKLMDQFPKLDQNKVYLLYCNHGSMSRLQAMHLYQQGFRNIKVYSPDSN